MQLELTLAWVVTDCTQHAFMKEHYITRSSPSDCYKPLSSCWCVWRPLLHGLLGFFWFAGTFLPLMCLCGFLLQVAVIGPRNEGINTANDFHCESEMIVICVRLSLFYIQILWDLKKFTIVTVFTYELHV